MATDHHNHDHHSQHADVAYERTDLSHRGIWAFFAFLAISTVVIFVAIAALYKGFGYAEAKLAPEPNPMAVRAAMPSPEMMQNTAAVDMQKFTANGTQPLLQTNDTMDMESFRKQEEMILKAAPWKDEKGDIHIPIDQAMKMVAQRSLPVRAQAANPAAPDPSMVPENGGFGGFMAVQRSADSSAAMTGSDTESQGSNTGKAIETKGETHSTPTDAKVPPSKAKVPKQ